MFKRERFVESTFWDKVKVNLPTLYCKNNVMKLTIGKLKIDKQLFKRFLVLSKSRDNNLQYVLSFFLTLTCADAFSQVNIHKTIDF